MMIPTWLHVLSIVALAAGACCALVIAAHLAAHPQRMWIMDVVWPVTALFGSGLSLWLYFRYGTLASKARSGAAHAHGGQAASKRDTPFPAMVAKGAAHCGSGCCLGDIAAEWLAFAFPGVAVWFGWHSLFSEKMFAVWVLDFVFAFVLGVAFQYFTIAPMRHLGPLQGLWQAVKADALSLSAWQLGMYGFMAFAQFYLFTRLLGVRLAVDMPEFWFMMQLAMLCGIATSYPVNWWLIEKGLKEKM